MSVHCIRADIKSQIETIATPLLHKIINVYSYGNSNPIYFYVINVCVMTKLLYNLAFCIQFKTMSRGGSRTTWLTYTINTLEYLMRLYYLLSYLDTYIHTAWILDTKTHCVRTSYSISRVSHLCELCHMSHNLWSWCWPKMLAANCL